MRFALLSVAWLLASIHFARALDAAEIRKLAAEPHDRTNLLPELKIFAEAREYTVTAKSGKPGEKLVEAPSITVTQKTVQGRYIISEFPPEGGTPLFIIVVAFEKEEGVFKKWILSKEGTVDSHTGIGDLEKRSIAWVSEVHGDRSLVLALEVHGDDKTTWKDTVVEAGKPVFAGEGLAVRTK